MAESVALVGALDAGNVDHARRLLERLPAGLRDAARRTDAAGPMVLALLLAEPEAVMQRQLDEARAAGAAALAETARGYAAEAARLPPALRLPLVDLALPALKAQPDDERRRLLAALEAVIRADRRVSLHEFVVLTLVKSQLLSASAPPARKSISELRNEAMQLLALVAHAGRGAKVEDAEGAFRAGERQLGLAGSAFPAVQSLSLQAVSQALEKLRTLAPLAKSEFMAALFAAVTADGKVKIGEAELMRLAGAVLGCPLPPMLEEIEPEPEAA